MNVSDPEDSDRRLKALAMVSASVSLVFILIQVLVVFSTVPQFAEMYRALGSDLSLWAGLIGSVGNFGLTAILLVFHVTVFFVMYRMASRHGVGLVFVPLALNLVLAILLPFLLYMPMFRVFDVIK